MQPTETPERRLAETVRLVDILEESRADLTRQNRIAEMRIGRALIYADLLTASAARRPEVAALDAAWAIRNALGSSTPAPVTGPFALYVDGICWGDGYAALDEALADALQATLDRDDATGVAVRAVSVVSS